MFLFKLAIKNIFSKKIQSSMITLVFVLISVLCISSTSIKDLAMKAKQEQLRDNTMNSQISVFKDSNSNYYFDLDTKDKFHNIHEIVQIVPRLSDKVIFKNNTVNLIGTDLKRQQEVYNFDFVEKTGDVYSEHNSAIISANFSKKHGLSLYKSIELLHNDNKITLTVRGILKNTSAVQNEIITDITNAQNLLKANGKTSSLRITISDLSKIDLVQRKMLKSIDGYDLNIKKQYDLSTYETYTGVIHIALSILLFFIILVSTFLCYSMFKTHIFEKSKQYGVLKSIGLSKTKILKLEYLEYFMITIPALTIGTILSVPAVNYIVSNISGYSSNSENIITFKSLLLFALIIIVPGITFLFDIYKSSKASVVEQIKGLFYSSDNKNKFIKLAIGIFLLLVSGFLYFLNVNFQSLILIICSAIFFVISFLILGEYVVNLQLKIISFTVSLLFSKAKSFFKEMVHQINGLKNSIILMILVVGLGCVGLTVYNVTNGSVQDVYKNSDILLSNYNSNKNDIVSKEINVLIEKTIHTAVKRCNKKINDDNIIISGIDTQTYKDVAFEIPQKISLDEMFDRLLNQDRGIIISQSLSKSQKIDVGNEIKINGLDTEVRYTVIGIVSSFENMGKVAFISEKNFDTDFIPTYTDFLIFCSNKSEIEDIKNKLEKNLEEKTSFNILEIKELLKENSQRNHIIFMMLGCIILISMIVSIVGLVNDLTINILKQEKDFAIKRAIGFSKKRIILNVILLGLLSGITCGICGFIFGSILNIYILDISSYYIGSLSNIKSNTPVYLILLSMLVGITGSIYPAIKINYLNVVEKIKGGE